MSAVTTASDPTRTPAKSLRTAVARAEWLLRSEGVQSPRHDAESVAAHLLRVPRSKLWRHMDDPTPTGFFDLIGRRAARVPLQHITGTAYFRNATLAVGPGVFLPRPETEVVVGEALRLLTGMGTAPLVVDLCAGSGAIALSIATECPRSTVHAVELDPGAGPWLDENVSKEGVHVHRVDMSGCLAELENRVDLVIANPPYIPVDAVPRDLEVARYEPELALYSGEDGLDHIRIVEQNAARLLRSGGWVVVEHADQQGHSAPQIFASALGWENVQDHVDLTGRDRFLTAQRTEPREVR